MTNVAVASLGMSEDVYGFTGLAFLGVPVAFAVAILRYRLYDIGQLVRRTVSYGLLAAVLAGVYALGVVGVGSLAARWIGEGSLVVAATTLVIAALFRPLRRWIQALIDRRFDRGRYNAQRLVDDFAARTRSTTGPSRVVEDVAGVVAASLRPATLSIWLRQGDRE